MTLSLWVMYVYSEDPPKYIIEGIKGNNISTSHWGIKKMRPFVDIITLGPQIPG
jgi:hypothetical protein